MFNRYKKSVRKPFWAYAGIIPIYILCNMYMYVQCTVNIHILPENCSQDERMEEFPFLPVLVINFRECKDRTVWRGGGGTTEWTVVIQRSCLNCPT